jgi:integrase
MSNHSQRRQVGGSIRRVTTKSGPRWRFVVDLGPDPDTGRRRQRQYTFSTENEAVQQQAALRVAVTAHAYVDRSRLTVNEYLDVWLAAGERHWRPSTHVSYAGAVQPARDAFGTTRLQRLERADIEALVAAMLRTGGRDGRGRSPRTVALLLTILNKALKDAVADDLLARNPAQHVRKPTSPHTEMAVWDSGQAARFLDHVTDHPLTGALNLTMRGLRRGEVLGLQWGDIDFARGLVHIRRTRTQAGSRGVVVGPPKTSRGRRSLPLDPPLAEALRRTHQATVTEAVVRTLTSPADRWVTVDEMGEPLRPERYGDLFTTLAAEAGLPRIRLHDARHTALTLLLERGVPVHVVARFAGHDPAITMRQYAHVTQQGMDQASGVFGAAFGQVR